LIYFDGCGARVLADVTLHLRKSAQSVDKISPKNPQIAQIHTDLLHGICDFSCVADAVWNIKAKWNADDADTHGF
jgi:hypothetical protein